MRFCAPAPALTPQGSLSLWALVSLPANAWLPPRGAGRSWPQEHSTLEPSSRVLCCLWSPGTHFTDEGTHSLFLKPAGGTQIQSAADKAILGLVWEATGSLPTLSSPTCLQGRCDPLHPCPFCAQPGPPARAHPMGGGTGAMAPGLTSPLQPGCGHAPSLGPAHFALWSAGLLSAPPPAPIIFPSQEEGPCLVRSALAFGERTSEVSRPRELGYGQSEAKAGGW